MSPERGTPQGHTPELATPDSHLISLLCVPCSEAAGVPYPRDPVFLPGRGQGQEGKWRLGEEEVEVEVEGRKGRPGHGSLG